MSALELDIQEHPPGSKSLKWAVVALVAVMAVMGAVIVSLAVRETTAGQAANPYEINVPSIVADTNEDGEAIALDGTRVRVLTSRCNTTDGTLSLDIEPVWVKDIETGASIVPGIPLLNVPVDEGGAACDDPDRDPILSSIALPEQVIADPGTWQYRSQILVRECLDAEEDVDGRLKCNEQGVELDQIGWFSEPFLVE